MAPYPQNVAYLPSVIAGESAGYVRWTWAFPNAREGGWTIAPDWAWPAEAAQCDRQTMLLSGALPSELTN